MYMSLEQKLKDCFQPLTTRHNKENNSILSNQINKNNQKKALLPQKSKTMTTKLASSTFIPYNIEQNLSVIGQEIKDNGYGKRANANKVKKALAFDKNPLETKKESSDKFAKGEMFNKGRAIIDKFNKNRMVIENPRQVGLKENPMEISSEEKMHSTQEKSSNTSSFAGDMVIEKNEVNVEVDTKECNNRMVRVYAQDIIETLKEKDESSRIVNCLENHNISSKLRAKMVDWMVEVLCSYKCSDQTFFLAVNIMDAYFKKSPVQHSTNDLHAVGVTSMFIASKYEEIYPIRLSILYEKVGHKKLSMEEILKKEGEILSVLGFNLVSVTTYEFICNVLFQLGIKETMTTELYDYLQRVCLYLSKANLYDYELINQYTTCELAACTLFVAFKVTEQVESNFPVTSLVDMVCEILGVEDEVLYACATKILNLAKNFEKLYPSFKNLRKFHSIGAPGKSGNADSSIIAENTGATAI